MAILATQQVLQTGVGPTTQAAAGGGDKVTPGDNVWLEVTNGGGAPITATVNCVTPSNYGTDEDLVVSVPNATTRRIGPINARRFASNSDGMADVTYSGVTSVTVAAWKI